MNGMKDEFRDDIRYITKTEMARRLSVTPRTIETWMHKGLVPFRKIGRTVRFDWGEVCAHFAQRPRGPQSVPLNPSHGNGVAQLLRERAREIRKCERRS